MLVVSVSHNSQLFTCGFEICWINRESSKFARTTTSVLKPPNHLVNSVTWTELCLYIPRHYNASRTLCFVGLTVGCQQNYCIQKPRWILFSSYFCIGTKKDTKPTRFWRVIWFTFEPRQLRIFAHKFVLKLNNVGAGLHSSVAFQRPQLLSIVGPTQSLFTASTDTDLLAMSRRLTRISQRPCNIYSNPGRL